MKIKFLFGLVVILALSALTFAQSVVIIPKKVVYTRKNIKGFETKRKFYITYPIVSGSISATAKKQLEMTISYWNVFETTLPENRDEYWLVEMSYKVKYNKNGILDIALTQEGVGAYPDARTVELIIDLKTGRPVKFDEVLSTDSLSEFARMVNAKLEIEKKQIIQKIDENGFGIDDKEANNSLKEDLHNLSFAAENFKGYSVSDLGITILYDAEFAHAFEAAQPKGRYFFKWAEIKSYIKPEGILSRFSK